jgi:hypothetical protein
MKTNMKMISLIAMLLPLFALTSVNAQRLNLEAAVKSRLGFATSVKKVPAATKKTNVEIGSVKSDIIGVTDKKVVVGSWLETITFGGSDPAPPLKSLVTFFEDGNMLVADQGAVSPGVVFSAGHGSWTHRRERTFAWSSVEIMYDPATGALVGYLKVSGVYTVDIGGNEYDGTFAATICAPDGTVLFSVDGTNSGNRILVE